MSNGFKNFLIEQNVVGIATGLAVGGAASALATSFVNDIVMPPIGYLFGSTNGIKGLTMSLGMSHGQEVFWNYGMFLGLLIDFVIIALVFYFTIKIFKLDKIGQKK